MVVNGRHAGVVGNDELQPERGQDPVIVGPEAAHALEGTARVGPVEGGDEALRTEHQLLPADAEVSVAAVEIADLQVEEQVLEIEAILIDAQGRQVLTGGAGADDLGIDAEDVLVPEVAENADAEEVV